MVHGSLHDFNFLLNAVREQYFDLKSTQTFKAHETLHNHHSTPPGQKPGAES